jgi:hypothetical protein
LSLPSGLEFGVAPVDELVLGEFGVEGDAEESALVAGIDFGESGVGFGDFAIRGNNAKAAKSLGDQQVVVGKKGEAPRRDETFCNDNALVAHVELLLLDAGLAKEGGPLVGNVRVWNFNALTMEIEES